MLERGERLLFKALDPQILPDNNDQYFDPINATNRKNGNILQNFDNKITIY